MSEEFKHPAAMMADYEEGQNHGISVLVGTNKVFSCDDPEEAFRIFFYLNKHQECCEDDEGNLLPLSMVAAGDSVLVEED